MAIEQGLTILSWYENLPKKEVPPERIWADSKGLDEWWERIRGSRDNPSTTATGEQVDDPELVGNDLARAYKD